MNISDRSPHAIGEQSGVGFLRCMAWSALAFQILTTVVFLIAANRPVHPRESRYLDLGASWSAEGSTSMVPTSALIPRGEPQSASRRRPEPIPPGLEAVPPLFTDDPGVPGDGRLATFIASNEPGRILTMCVEISEIAEEPNTFLVGATRCLIRDPFSPGVGIQLLVPTQSQPGIALRGRCASRPAGNGADQPAIIVLSIDGSEVPELRLEYILSWAWPDLPPFSGTAGATSPSVGSKVLTKASDVPRSSR